MRKVLCKIGIHKRGPWEKVSLAHYGEYPWASWTHICHAFMRGDCERCGLPSRRKRRLCTPPIYDGPKQTRNGLDCSGLPEANVRLFAEHN